MATEYKRIVLRKGVFSSLPTDLLPGELAFTTDTKQLFIGTDTGNKEIPVENIVMSDITDVDLANLANGDILKYSTSSGNWEAQHESYVTSMEIATVNGAKILTIGLNGGTSLSATLTNVLPLDALAGVVITEGVQNDVLQHNGQEWVDAPLNMEQLGNVSVSEIGDGQVLKWNATTSRWENNGDTDSQITVDTFGFETGTKNLQLQQTNGTTLEVDFSDITVQSFGLNQTTTYACVDGNGDPVVGGTDEASCSTAGGTWTSYTTTNYDQLDLTLNDGTVLSADISQVAIDGTVEDFRLSGSDQILLDVYGEAGTTTYTIDLSGIRNSLVNGFTLNNTNDPGTLKISTIGGTTYEIDTFAVYDPRYLLKSEFGAHTHGKINNDGQIPSTTAGIDVDIETGDKLLIINSGASDTITTADILFDTSETGKYLSQAGEFTTPTFDTSGLATSTHTHGNITNDGSINGQGVGIGLNDRLVIYKAADSNLNKTTIYFDASQSTKYLSQDGTFSVPSFTPGNYVETDITELVTSGTYAFSNFASYDKLIAVLYSDPNASFNTSAGVSDTVEIRQALQLHFETYVDNTNGTCYVNGEPTLAQNQQECEIAGGTWVGTTFTSTGKVNFQPGGKLERISSTNVQFTQPTAVNGHTWKLKIIGVTF